jgi:hypothetical protein
VNRITRYALALALGLSAISTAAFAAGPSTDQSANAQYGYSQTQGAPQSLGAYDGPDMYSSPAS